MKDVNIGIIYLYPTVWLHTTRLYSRYLLVFVNLLREDFQRGFGEKKCHYTKLVPPPKTVFCAQIDGASGVAVKLSQVLVSNLPSDSLRLRDGRCRL